MVRVLMLIMVPSHVKGALMKYFFLFLVVLGAIGYTFYYGGDDSVWTDDDLKTLVLQKNESLCAMPELLEEHNTNPKQCGIDFLSQVDTCLVETEAVFPGDEFDSKHDFLKAFNTTLSCIVVNMKSSE